MNPIWRRMKKRSPSSGQNGQLVHWWLLVHSGHMKVVKTGTQLVCGHTSTTLNQTLLKLKDNRRCVCKEGTELGTFEIRACAQFQE
jgi:hypothetical protein